MSESNKLNQAIAFFNKNFSLMLVIIATLVVGFFVISFFQNSTGQKKDGAVPQIAGEAGLPQEKPENVPLISETDHVKGATDPQVTLFEYSDFNCPFCARLHPTVQKLVDNYPQHVAWVYRHFLLGGIGSASGQAALITECISQDYGNVPAWQFITAIYDAINNEERITSVEGYFELAAALGFNRNNLEACIQDEAMTEQVNAHLTGAREVGVLGTPALILMTSDGQYEFIAGAVPYESLEAIVLKYLD